MTLAYAVTLIGQVTKFDSASAALASHPDTEHTKVMLVGSAADLAAYGADRVRDLYWLLEPDAAGKVTDPDPEVVFNLIAARGATSEAPTTAANPNRETTKMEVQTETTAKTPKAAKGNAAVAPKGKGAAAKKGSTSAPKAAKVKTQRAKGKDPKKAAEFKSVLKGSKRGKILELMTGQHTAEAIGKKLGIPTSLVSSNIFCLHRDIGIGYTYGEGGALTATFPAGKTMADALKTAGTPPAKPAAKKKAK